MGGMKGGALRNNMKKVAWKETKQNKKEIYGKLDRQEVYSVLMTYFGLIIFALKPDVSLVALSQPVDRPATFHTQPVSRPATFHTTTCQ